MAKFKKGDRVRTKGYEGTNWDGEGVVTEEYDGFCILARINEREGGFAPHELAPAPLQLEAGKFYRTRDGRKVGPMRAYAARQWDVGDDAIFGASLWRNDGSAILEDAGADLIAEWVDEPQEDEPVTAATQPKFKVGDRVRVLADDFDTVEPGTLGTVMSCDDWYTVVDIDAPFDGHGDSGRAWNFFHPGEELALAASPTDNTPTPTTGFTVPLCAYDNTVTTTALGDAYVAGYQAGLAAATAQAA